MNRKLAVVTGVAFLIGCGVDAPTLNVGSSGAPLGSDISQYNFESGVQGWAKGGTKITSVATSAAQSFLGNQSLAVNVVTTGTASGQQVTVPSTAQLAGKTITYNIFLPTGIKLTSIQVFAQENASHGWAWNANWQPAANLRLGQWNTLTLAIPSNAAPLQTIGVEFAFSGAWSGAAFIDSIGWTVATDAGSSVTDAGSPVVDAGSPVVDAGSPVVDAGADLDAGSPVVDAGADLDAGSPVVDAGAEVDAGPLAPDAGDPDAGTPTDPDAGTQPVPDAGTPPPPLDGGTVTAIRFGIHAGGDGLFSSSPVDANLRTIAGWIHLRASVAGLNRQMNAWSLENKAPSNAYQLFVTTYHKNQWETHDSKQGGFLFAPVDLGWWFFAETNRAAGPATILYWKKDSAATLSVTSGNTHPSLSGMTRFLIGTDDATGQNEWVDGDITGVKVWNAVLTKAELELEAKQLTPVRTANLHAFYPLQSLSTMLSDYSGNGRDLAPITPATSGWSVQPGPAIPY